MVLTWSNEAEGHHSWCTETCGALRVQYIILGKKCLRITIRYDHHMVQQQLPLVSLTAITWKLNWPLVSLGLLNSSLFIQVWLTHGIWLIVSVNIMGPDGKKNGTAPANSHKAVRLKDTVYSTNHTKWELMLSEWSEVSLKGRSHGQLNLIVECQQVTASKCSSLQHPSV